MKNKIIVALLLVFLSAYLIFEHHRHQSQEPRPTGERMPVEVYPNILNAVAINTSGRFLRFGLVTLHEYSLEVRVKQLPSTLGEVLVEINLPEEIEILEGNPVWSGYEKEKTLNLFLKPQREGDFTINITAENTEIGFKVTSLIVVHVRNTPQAAIEATHQEELVGPHQPTIIKSAP